MVSSSPDEEIRNVIVKVKRLFDEGVPYRDGLDTLSPAINLRLRGFFLFFCIPAHVTTCPVVL